MHAPQHGASAAAQGWQRAAHAPQADADSAAGLQAAAASAVDAALHAAHRVLAADTTLNASDALDATMARHGQARLRSRLQRTHCAL